MSYTQGMQSVVSDSAPFDDVLLREGNITVTSSRLEISNTTYALKYIATVTLSELHPPRKEARTVIGLSVLALIAIVIYLILGKMAFNSFLVFALLAILALTVGAAVYWLDPSKYTLDLKMISGELVQVNSTSERFIHQVHAALATSLATNHPQPTVLDAETELV